MEAGEHTVEVPFQEKISLKSTARQHTLPGGSVRTIALSLIYIVADTICIAKSLVAAGLARRALVQLSYAIGVAEPLSIYVDTYGTGKKTDEELVEIIRNNWDLRPGIIGMCFVVQVQVFLAKQYSDSPTARSSETSVLEDGILRTFRYA